MSVVYVKTGAWRHRARPDGPRGGSQVFRRGRAPPWCLGGFPKPSTGPSDAITTAYPIATPHGLVPYLEAHVPRSARIKSHQTLIEGHRCSHTHLSHASTSHQLLEPLCSAKSAFSAAKTMVLVQRTTSLRILLLTATATPAHVHILLHRQEHHNYN